MALKRINKVEVKQLKFLVKIPCFNENSVYDLLVPSVCQVMLQNTYINYILLIQIKLYISYFCLFVNPRIFVLSYLLMYTSLFNLKARIYQCREILTYHIHKILQHTIFVYYFLYKYATLFIKIFLFLAVSLKVPSDLSLVPHLTYFEIRMWQVFVCY